MLSDSLLTDIVFRRTRVLLQPFVLIRVRRIVAIIPKIVYDLFLTGTLNLTEQITRAIHSEV